MFSLVSAGVSTPRAQELQVGQVVVVAGETEPRRFSEPHLAIDPRNANHFLAAVWTGSTSQDETKRGAVFRSYQRTVG